MMKLAAAALALSLAGCASADRQSVSQNDAPSRVAGVVLKALIAGQAGAAEESARIAERAASRRELHCVSRPDYAGGVRTDCE